MTNSRAQVDEELKKLNKMLTDYDNTVKVTLDKMTKIINADRDLFLTQIKKLKQILFVGEEVEYEETCNRGCCQEFYIKGPIERIDGDKIYIKGLETRAFSPWNLKRVI